MLLKVIDEFGSDPVFGCAVVGNVVVVGRELTVDDLGFIDVELGGNFSVGFALGH